MSDSVPGFRDIKMKTIQSVENRCRENFSLNSLYESYKKKNGILIKQKIMNKKESRRDYIRVL